MTLGLPILLTSKATGAASITSDSFTPTAGRLLVVIGGARRGAATASAPFTITSTGTSLTFTKTTELNAENGTSSPSARQAVWVADIPATVASSTITLESVNASHTTIVVIEIADARWRSPNAGSGASNLGDPTASMAAGVTGLGLYAATWAGNPTIVAQPGTAETANVVGTNSKVVVRYSTGSIGTSGAWTTDGTRAVAAILGIEEASATTAIDFPANLEPAFDRTVAAMRGISESCALEVGFSVTSSITSSPERPAQTWQGATRTWRMPEGTEPIAGSNLTFATTGGGPSTGFSHVADITMYQWLSTSPSVTNFLMPVSVIKPDLRSAANGGKVQSSSGWDIRFETVGGTKVAHKIITYDPVNGELTALINTPRNLATNDTLRCRIGKSGLTASEEDPAGLRAGGWEAIYIGSGTEFTGQSGRDITAFGSPTGNVFVGSYPARRFNGSNQYYQGAGAATFLNGLSELTVFSAHAPDTTAPKMEVFNLADGANAEMSMHFNDTTTDRITFTVKFGSTVYQYQSANETQGPAYTGQYVAVAAKAGEAVRMAINGERDTPGSSASIPAGATTSVTRFLEWGRGGRGDLAYWNGELSILAFCSVAQPMDVLEAMTFAFSFDGPGLFGDFTAA